MSPSVSENAKYRTIDDVDAAFCPRVHDDVIVDRTPDAIFLLHPTQPRWALTNATGLAMADWFDGTVRVADAANRLLQKYQLNDVAPVLGDAMAFVRQLYDANLLANLPLAETEKIPTRREPQRLTIYLTEECNLRCKHCFVVEGKMPKPTITADDVRRMIDEHLELNPEALIAFTGGEAMLRDDCIELMQYAASKTPYVSLNTNGLLIDEAKARALVAMCAAIQVSLDGADPEVHDFLRGKGSFKKTMHAIELLCAAGGARTLRTSTTLTRCALSQVKELIARFEAMNVYELRFLILNKMRAAETNWDQIVPDPTELLAVYRYLLIERPRQANKSHTRIEGEFPGFVPYPDPNGYHWCPIGETTIVDSQGNTYGCPSLLLPEYRSGNIKSTPIRDIQFSESHKRLREKMLERRYVIPECKACAWRNFCQGGCQAFTQLRTGDMLVMDEFCDFRRELYRTHALLDAEHGPQFHGPAC